jgi:hypothetical protein
MAAVEIVLRNAWWRLEMSDDEIDNFGRQIEQHLLRVDDGFRFTDTSGKT